MDEQKKQRFSEVIGGLVSGVSYARSVADMEAMRIAYYYHQHELLKGMPIPRLRIQRVSISLPIIVTEVIPGVAAIRNPAVDVARSVTEALVKAFQDAMKEFADIRKLKEQQKSIVSPDEEELQGRFEQIVTNASDKGAKKRFESQLRDDLEHAYMDLNLSEGSHPSDASMRHMAGQVAESVLRQLMTEHTSAYVHQKAVENETTFDLERGKKAVQELMDHEITSRLIKTVRHAAEENATLTRTVPPDFYVQVNTGDVKNHGNPDVVTRVDMVLKEEGLEWMTEENDGKKSSKLMQE